MYYIPLYNFTRGIMSKAKDYYESVKLIYGSSVQCMEEYPGEDLEKGIKMGLKKVNHKTLEDVEEKAEIERVKEISDAERHYHNHSIYLEGFKEGMRCSEIIYREICKSLKL